MRRLGNRVSPGTRVKVVRDPDWDGPWPTEPTGVIADGFEAPLDVIDLARERDVNVPETDRVMMRTFMVRFDEPVRDGDGCGPYYMAEVWEKHLRLLNEPGWPLRAIERLRRFATTW